MTLVIDASVCVKWLVYEEHTAAAIRLADTKTEFLAPDLLRLEVASALTNKVRRGELPAGEISLLARVPNFVPDLVPWQPLLDPALELALVLQRPLYDCLYLALALRENTAMVTADDRLFNSLQGSTIAHTVMSIQEF
ncbi:MAG: type II toxin-antitoxin system VapC family toxin [Dehalococcoidia bacterium]